MPQLPHARRRGWLRGPALDSVAMRMTHDQLVRQVVQGGGNMPAYGKNLSPAEVTALVSFLETLHPEGQRPARDASQQYISSGELDPRQIIDCRSMEATAGPYTTLALGGEQSYLGAGSAGTQATESVI